MIGKAPQTAASFPWKGGQSGNRKGRPIGARNKFGQAFLEDMFANWKAHGAATIDIVRTEHPQVYLKIMAGILPRHIEMKVNEIDELSDEEVSQQLAATLRELQAAGVDPFAEGDAAEGEQPTARLSALG